MSGRSEDLEREFDRLWEESASRAANRLFDVVPFEVCVICGSDKNVEQHHWAPQAIFPETEWWCMTVALCAQHHHEWHDRMREHGLRWPHELIVGE